MHGYSRGASLDTMNRMPIGQFIKTTLNTPIGDNIPDSFNNKTFIFYSFDCPACVVTKKDIESTLSQILIPDRNEYIKPDIYWIDVNQYCGYNFARDFLVIYVPTALTFDCQENPFQQVLAKGSFDDGFELYQENLDNIVNRIILNYLNREEERNE